MARVLVAGSYNAATTVLCPDLPVAGQTILGFGTFQEPGGKGSNQAIAAARLGAVVTLLVKVGDDIAGDAAIRLFVDEGLSEVGLLRTATADTGVAYIFTNSAGENQIAVVPGANADLAAADAPEGLVEEADVLLCQLECSEELFIGLAKRARQAGVLTILNPAPARELSEETYQLADVMTPNESELEVLSGHPIATEKDLIRAVDLLHSRGTGIIVATLGARGAFWSDQERRGYVNAPRVEVVDTTGAGDAFNGALAVALGDGLPTSDAVRLAVLSGSYCATRRGVIGGLARSEDIGGFGS